LKVKRYTLKKKDSYLESVFRRREVLNLDH
jgi:hypothetical protein